MNTEDLWLILDTERRTVNIQQLPLSFTHDLQLYIANLELDINGKEELHTARRRVVNLIQRRQGKIVKLAVANAKMPGSLLWMEKAFFEQIREAGAAFEECVLKELNGK